MEPFNQMQLALLIPVKDFSHAKQRLAPLLSVAEREELGRLMLDGVVAAVVALPSEVRKVIVTSYQPAKALGAAQGFEVLSEKKQISESDSVDYACAELEKDGVGGVLRVPLDLPLIQTSDLERILELSQGDSATVLAPSFDGTGTNALYRSPPTLFPSQFGPDSLALHQQLAEEHGCIVEWLPSLALDIDSPADIAVLMRTESDSPVKAYLERIAVLTRLEEFAHEGSDDQGSDDPGDPDQKR